MRRLKTTAGLLTALLLVWMATAPSPAGAQSITGGALTGHVYDLGGSPVFDADVTLENVATGLVRSWITDRTGGFLFTFLAAGEYSIRVEAVGYRPVQVLRVPIGPGRASPVTVRLREEPPPVVAIDTITLTGSAADRIRPGVSRWMSSFELSHLPDRDRAGTAALSLLSEVSADGGTDGLPSSFTGFYLDGIEYRPATAPGGGPDPLFGMLVPRSFLSGAEVTRAATETEFGGSGGATFSALTRSGGPNASIDAYGDYTGGGTLDLPEYHGRHAGESQRSWGRGGKRSHRSRLGSRRPRSRDLADTASSHTSRWCRRRPEWTRWPRWSRCRRIGSRID